MIHNVSSICYRYRLFFSEWHLFRFACSTRVQRLWSQLMFTMRNVTFKVHRFILRKFPNRSGKFYLKHIFSSKSWQLYWKVRSLTPKLRKQFKALPATECWKFSQFSWQQTACKINFIIVSMISFFSLVGFPVNRLSSVLSRHVYSASSLETTAEKFMEHSKGKLLRSKVISSDNDSEWGPLAKWLET